MFIHLLVVGKQDPNEDADEVAAAAGDAQTAAFRVARCGSPNELVKVVRQIAYDYGPIETLDLYDHGDEGAMRMGDAWLFDYLGDGRVVARLLRPFLTADARLRLLGCKTAMGAKGRALLGMLREELGGSVVVFGTIVDVDATNFPGGAFRPEDRLLFSSTEAATREAPSYEQREAECNLWQASIAP